MFTAGNPTFWIAFLAGLLSFVSPCCLPLYPSYLSYITGVSYEQMQDQRDQGAVKRRALAHALFFVLGFSIIFVALGLSAGTIGRVFSTYSTLIRQVGGIVIIVMGLFMAGFLRVEWLMREMKWHTAKKPAGYLGAVIVGISFAAGWTPCIGPILASVLVVAATNPVSGMSLMVFYSLGFAIPFLIMAYTLGSVRWLLKYSGMLSKIGGIGMVLMGILLITNAMTSITTYLIRIFGGFTGF
ncbi:cytochrome c biogenesis protein CcdA [Tumebacillus sp. ITR2]|uniref:Cytochrome c biogenesis protein CcdA n=1 Tax=Tumebacillus amylolyticus TaxID=2801339 RepID=A0ABS1J5Q6_9BACL|nr:cytochrome c biogenesis protein CcdA [Tumebacillus amylolyticus]MBL0385567.1 cytochrome c biogenesis protein CcdA [Tumebacillus amylolyticus]